MRRPNLSLPAMFKPIPAPKSPYPAGPSPMSHYFSLLTGNGGSNNHFGQNTSNGGPSGQSGNGGKSSSSSGVFRPTRRDILLVLMTLSFSYLLFSSPSEHAEMIKTSRIYNHVSSSSPTSSPGYPGEEGDRSSGSSSGSKGWNLPGWHTIFGNSNHEDTRRIGEEPTVSDGARTVDFAVTPKDVGIAAGWWDGGEEEAEDDELQGMETKNLGHQAGWTLMDRAYTYNGSVYVVTEERSLWPELIQMTSTGLPANDTPGNGEARKPKGNEIVFITPEEALQLWEGRVYRISGTTWVMNDGQFIDHYYHFAAEWLLGAWRTYCSLDPEISPFGDTKLVAPKRFWFLHLGVDEWRDLPRFNPTILSAAFPSLSFLYPQDWSDLAKQTTSDKPIAYMFDRLLYTDRSAAFYGEYTIPTSRTVAGAIHIGQTSNWWWEPIRRAVLRYSGVSQEILDRNLEGIGAIDPLDVAEGKENTLGLSAIRPVTERYRFTVLYISRQSSRRRLAPESHEALVAALEERAERCDFELIIVEAEKLSKQEQFALAGKATIMLGVHGNGLTHLLWMPATPRSAVIEMYFVGGFARDYQWTAHTLGIRHFGVNHDLVFTAPDLPEVVYPEGFHGTQITVDAKTVADLIQDRLEGRV